jgi:hypothetical protein
MSAPLLPQVSYERGEKGRMNQASPCPYCGNIGYHMWAGGGGCPGAVSERERDAVAVVYLRAYAETIKLQDAEIERLKALLKDRMYELEEINELKNLVYRAADALEDLRGPGWKRELIVELRKAAPQ